MKGKGREENCFHAVLTFSTLVKLVDYHQWGNYSWESANKKARGRNCAVAYCSIIYTHTHIQH